MPQDFNQWLTQQNIQPGEPLDTGAGKRPYTDFDSFMAAQQPEADKLEPATQAQVPKMGAPQEAPVEPTQAPVQNGQVSDLEQPYSPQPQVETTSAGPSQFSGGILGGIGSAGEAIKPDTQEAVQNYIRDEGLPTAAGLAGGLLAASTAPVSVPTLILATAAGAGLGGFAGEYGEQKLKQVGLIEKPVDEMDIKTEQDIMEQAIWRGGEEALWSLVPDAVIVGSKGLFRKMFKPGTEDVVKLALEEVVKKEAAKKGEEAILTVSDVSDIAAFDMMDALAANSMAKNVLTEARAKQREQVLSAAQRFLGEQKGPAAQYATNLTDEMISQYVGANFEIMNNHATAALVRRALTNAQELKKNVARAKYNAIGDLMEPDMANQLMVKEATGRLDRKGNPVYRIKNLSNFDASFPVDLRSTRKVAEDQMEIGSRLMGEEAKGTAGLLTPELKELIGMADMTDFKAASTKLSQMKNESASLMGVENAANRKRLLDDAIRQLDNALNDSLAKASEAGIRGPNGETLEELKAAADAVWKEQSDDFGNKFIKEILKHTDPKDGNPAELSRLFLKDDTHALKIVKALGEGEPELMEAARNAIKGQVANDIFVPFDKARGRYSSPSYEDLEGRKEALMMLFSKEEYNDMVKLADSLARVNGEDRANILSFAQQARESGQAIQILQDVAQGNNPLPNMQKFFATLGMAFGGGHLMTNKAFIATMKNASDEGLPPYLQRQYMSRVAHQLINYYNSQDASMTAEQRARWEDQLEAEKDYRTFLQQNKKE